LAEPSRRRNVLAVEADVSDERAVQTAVKTVIDRFGRLDAIVSNAGIMARKPLRRLTLADWRKVIDTNLTATFLLARAAERPLRATKGALVTMPRPTR
jgi:NAD(P)-dependent dehydrogenase (short-subunit alcohol dehydrogenase family)